MLVTAPLTGIQAASVFGVFLVCKTSAWPINNPHWSSTVLCLEIHNADVQVERELQPDALIRAQPRGDTINIATCQHRLLHKQHPGRLACCVINTALVSFARTGIMQQILCMRAFVQHKESWTVERLRLSPALDT